MTEHRVVVFSANVSTDEAAELRTGVLSPQLNVSVAVCFDCPWRGRVCLSAQTAADERREHERGIR